MSTRFLEQNVNSLPNSFDHIRNETATRYGWSATLDIHAGDRQGSQYVGYDQILRRAVVPFNNVAAYAPVEIPADTSGNLESMPIPESFDINQWASNQRTTSRSARLCASDILRSYEEKGFTLFIAWPGIDEQVLGEIYDTLLPVDTDISTLKRTLEYLTNHGEENVAKISTMVVREQRNNEGKVIKTTLRDVAQQTLMELLNATNRAWTWRNEVLDDTENSMRRYASGGAGKVGPDALDRESYRETERTPPDLQVAKQQESLGVTITEKLADALKSLAPKNDNASEIAELKAQVQGLLAAQQAKEEAGAKPVKTNNRTSKE